VSLPSLRGEFRAGRLTKAEYITAMHERHAALFEYADLLPQTDIASIEITDNRLVLTTRSSGVRFICDRDDYRIAPIEILNFDSYEPAEFDMIRRLMKPGFTVLDIGANIGWFSLSIAREYPDVQVYAFEPIPKTFAYLEANTELNRLPNVHPRSFGFSSAPGELDFFFYPEGSVNASAVNLSDRADALRITCSVTTMDAWLADSGMTVDFVKCDVEGAELFVFQGGRRTLTEQQPMIFTEMLRKWSARFGYHPNQIIALLEAAGYACFRIADGGLTEFEEMDENTVETNFVFLHRDRHRTEIAALTRCGVHS
jgi:FkbM family methyltransferase